MATSRSSNLPRGVRPDGIALEGSNQPPISALFRENVEVVHPELDQHFLKLPVAVYRSQQLFLDQLHHSTTRAQHLRFVLRPALRFASRPLDRVSTALPCGRAVVG